MNKKVFEHMWCAYCDHEWNTDDYMNCDSCPNCTNEPVTIYRTSSFSFVYAYMNKHKHSTKQNMEFEAILKDIDSKIEQPFVTAKFGETWKEHQMRLLEEGQITVDMLINIAWIQGRRAILLERQVKQLLEEKDDLSFS